MSLYFVQDISDFPDWGIYEADSPEDASLLFEARSDYYKTGIVAEIKINNHPHGALRVDMS